jgi:UDP-glucose 4-epimerase
MSMAGRNILVTGGAGYIGSHTVLELLNQGADVTVIDNLENSKRTAIERVEALTGRLVNFIEVDLRHVNDANLRKLESVFEQNKYDAVIHFAGLKAVGESTAKPLEYYDNNVSGTINLLQMMAKYGVKTLVFSSSATVYGAAVTDQTPPPMVEGMPTGATNPYGHTKHMIEQILEDTHHADSDWSITALRYFNPVGAHESGQIGEDPSGMPNNLMPFVSQVAVGRRDKLQVFGNDYGTEPDGTGVRDYIHVTDLALGHIAALANIFQASSAGGSGHQVFNLGTGSGTSVLQLVSAFEKASGKIVPYDIVERRPGDVAQLVADPSRAKDVLGWHAERGIDVMCEDTWRWQSQNPRGYED